MSSNKPAPTLAEVAAGMGRPGETDTALAILMLSYGENERPSSLPASHWLSQASDSDLIVAERILADWSLPLVDVEDGEQPPATDDEFIARRVEEAEAEAAIANAITLAYDADLSEDSQIGVIDYPEPAAFAAEAVLEIEQHRNARDRAVAMLRAERERP